MCADGVGGARLAMFGFIRWRNCPSGMRQPEIGRLTVSVDENLGINAHVNLYSRRVPPNGRLQYYSQYYLMTMAACSAVAMLAASFCREQLQGLSRQTGICQFAVMGQHQRHISRSCYGGVRLGPPLGLGFRRAGQVWRAA